jgi:hypothetical protein
MPCHQSWTGFGSTVYAERFEKSRVSDVSVHAYSLIQANWLRNTLMGADQN